jgi:predicted AlkP superfamily pyrophosphatase or phosphodiesterase
MAGCGRSSPTSPSSPVASSLLLPAPAQALTAVIIISIDGLRPDAVQSAPAPSILALTGRGSYSWSAQTILPSNTLPSHVSMLTGFLPEAHGVTWDDYLPSRGSAACRCCI